MNVLLAVLRILDGFAADDNFFGEYDVKAQFPSFASFFKQQQDQLAVFKHFLLHHELDDYRSKSMLSLLCTLFFFQFSSYYWFLCPFSLLSYPPPLFFASCPVVDATCEDDLRECCISAARALVNHFVAPYIGEAGAALRRSAAGAAAGYGGGGGGYGGGGGGAAAAAGAPRKHASQEALEELLLRRPDTGHASPAVLRRAVAALLSVETQDLRKGIVSKLVCLCSAVLLLPSLLLVAHCVLFVSVADLDSRRKDPLACVSLGAVYINGKADTFVCTSLAACPSLSLSLLL